ncbi:outer membrane beta-barrel protein [Caulobacter sp.]|uniref:outer membrane beta-barrel protein n=1 Tax=Caulobacter sp. TaxID=78 RepID=UPI003449A258|nr:outer membrane beta-barrel protein [Caulobacter sp.]
MAPIPAAAVQQPQSVATSAPPSSEAPSPSRTELGDGALLTRRDSLGRSKYTGIELTLSRKLSKNFTLEGTGEVSRNQIKYGSAMASGTRSGVIVSGHANLDWRLSDKDFLQVNITARGKRMMAQGHRLPSANVNLGRTSGHDPGCGPSSRR